MLLVLTSAAAALNILLLTAGLRSPQVRRIPLHQLTYAILFAYFVVQVVVIVSTSVSLHTGTRPDARPLLCQVEAVLTLFGATSALCCITAVAISRFLVIVKQRVLTRGHYSRVILICQLIGWCNALPLIIDSSSVSSNQGNITCTANVSDMQ